MSGNAPPIIGPLGRSSAVTNAQRPEKAWRAVAPSLLFGLRLWASVSLALYVTFWLELDHPYWAGASAAIMCQPQLGASLRKGWFRMIGTAIGAVVSVLLVACFPQDRVLFLGGLIVWASACAFAATVLRNFASYSSALAGYTTAIIAGDLLGATGGVDANAAFMVAVARASEICIGIVCAGIVLAGTDLGGARRQLAAQLAELSAEITAGFFRTLAIAGSGFADTRSDRREFVRRVVALDPVIDQTFGESSQIRYHSPILQSAVDGLFQALSAWRAVANHVETRNAAAVLEHLPPELVSPSQPERWIRDPVALHRMCEAAARRLAELPTVTPSLRLLADKAADACTGIADALNGLALLVADPARPMPRRGSKRLRVPDWLPALVNAGRAFVTMAAVALFWIVTAWPGGGNAITFAAIITLLFGPRSEQAYGGAILFIVGTVVTLALTAVVLFAVLPGLGTSSFASLSLVLALCLVPLGALLARARHAWEVGLVGAMALMFMPLLGPTNVMSYDPQTFYNGGLTTVFGACLGALAFRLMPPLSPAFRARRLLMLALRDLRRLAMQGIFADWEGHIYGRLAALPAEATPLQHAELLAALSLGTEIIRLCPVVRRFTENSGSEAAGETFRVMAGEGRRSKTSSCCTHDSKDVAGGLSPAMALRHRRRTGLLSNTSSELDDALATIAEGRSAIALQHLRCLDETLAGCCPVDPEVLQARASILVISGVLSEHRNYFDLEL